MAFQMQFLKSCLFFLTLVLAACSQPIQFTQPPTPQTIRIAYNSMLSPLTEYLQLCISAQTDAFFVLEEIPNLPDANPADLTIWLGEKPTSFASAFPFGWEKLSVVINQKNSLEDLPVDDIRLLFSGKIDNWKELAGEDRPVSVWVYPEDYEIQRQFLLFLGGDRQTTPLAYLASSPAIVKDAIANDPGAIGFLPNAWINAGLTSIQLETDSLTLPILALSSTGPQAGNREFIACLQSPQFQAAMKTRYQPWKK
jgi:PBP superfamily domain